MRVLKWILSIVLLIAVVAIVGGYIFLRNFDLNKYKDYAARIVYEQTGRKLAINGNAELGISLIPTLIINDVTLSNPDWAKNPQMLKLGSLELQLSIMPLLHKQIVIDKAILEQPHIYLETSAGGKKSWEFAAPRASAPTQKQAFNSGWLIASAHAAENQAAPSAEKPSPLGSISDIIARQVEITDGTLNYFDGGAKKSYKVAINNIALSTEGMALPVNVSWDVAYDNIQSSGKGTLGSLQDLLNNAPDYPVDLQLSALGLNAKVQAKLTDMAGDLKAKFDLQAQNPAGNLDAPAVNLTAKGSADMKNVALNIGKLDVAGNIITGKVSASLAGKLPSVAANLQSNLINVPSLTAVKKTAWQLPPLIASASASELVPNQTIPYQFLTLANGKADIAVKKLIISPEATASDVKLAATLNNGNLQIKPLDLKFGNGTVNLTADVNAGKKSVALKLNSQNILLQDVHQEFAVDSPNDFGFLSGGKTTVYADVSGIGSTYRQLVNNLSGQFIAFVGPSQIQSGRLRFLTNNFVVQLLSVLKIDTSKADQVDLKCAVVRSDIKGGKAVFPNGIAVDSNRLTLISNGKINLDNDSISLSLNAYQNGVSDFGIMQALSSLIRISGTLQSPTIAIDKGGAVKTIAGVVAGGPAALGANLLLDRDSAPCYTALKGTAYANVFPKPSGVSGAAQNTYQGTTNVVKDGVKDLKNSAKKLFNILK